LTRENFALTIESRRGDIAGHILQLGTTVMMESLSSTKTRPTPSKLEYSLTDFKSFKVNPKINMRQRDLNVYRLKVSSLNRQLLEVFHLRHIVCLADARESETV